MDYPEFTQAAPLPLLERVKLGAGPMLARWIRPGVTLVFAAALAVINYAGDVSWVQVVTVVVFTVGLHAGLRFTALSDSWVAGLWQQQMTWDVYRNRTWAPDEAEMAAEAERMRHVDERVQKFAAEHGMEQITLVVPGSARGTRRDPSAARRRAGISSWATSGSSPKASPACRTSWNTSSPTSSATTPVPT